MLRLLGVKDVDRLMGHVEITTKDDWLAKTHFKFRLQKVVEVFVPLVYTVVESLEVRYARVGHISGHQEEVFEV